jgi:Ribbon-helix-helix protein, copG family
MSDHRERERRGRVSARLDQLHLEQIEHIAAVERRPVSSVVRIAVEDWLASRTAGREGQAA